MIREESTDRTEIHQPSAIGYGSAAVAALFLLVAMLLGATIYALGQSTENFSWDNFRNGGLIFLLILAGTVTGGAAIAALIKLLTAVFPQTLRLLPERRRLQLASKRARSTIHRRRELQEEQARLSAMLQASYLFEKESARSTNAHAAREFQKSLQTGIFNSCEVVFRHLNNVMDQYEQVITEIETSSLPAAEKTELLNSLSHQLNASALDQRQRTARKMMEDAIWRVRLRKARLMASRNPVAARKYLESVRHPETSHRILIQIDALLKELQ